MVARVAPCTACIPFFMMERRAGGAPSQCGGMMARTCVVRRHGITGGRGTGRGAPTRESLRTAGAGERLVTQVLCRPKERVAARERNSTVNGGEGGGAAVLDKSLRLVLSPPSDGIAAQTTLQRLLPPCQQVGLTHAPLEKVSLRFHEVPRGSYLQGRGGSADGGHHPGALQTPRPHRCRSCLNHLA